MPGNRASLDGLNLKAGCACSQPCCVLLRQVAEPLWAPVPLYTNFDTINPSGVSNGKHAITSSFLRLTWKTKAVWEETGSH